MSDLITNKLTIDVKENPSKVVNYNDLDNPPVMIRMETATIVKKGTESGRPTVDIICKDEKGKEYLIFATGSIISLLGRAIEANS